MRFETKFYITTALIFGVPVVFLAYACITGSLEASERIRRNADRQALATAAQDFRGEPLRIAKERASGPEDFLVLRRVVEETGEPVLVLVPADSNLPGDPGAPLPLGALYDPTNGTFADTLSWIPAPEPPAEP